MKFTHLHVHSHYSLLDGLAKIDQILDACQELKMPSIALTDHGSMYGLVEFYKKAKKRGVRPILGCEAYVTPASMRQKRPNVDTKRYHLILLVKNEQGYQNLVKLTTKAYLQGFYYKPRIDKELLKKHAQGLIGASACMAGQIPRMIMDNKIDEAARLALEYQEIFGQGNFYLELQHHPNLTEQKQVNDALIKIAHKHKMPLVATNDAHYVKAEDAQAQDVLMSIQTDKRLADQERLTMKENDFSLRPMEQMIKDFKDVPEAIEHTQEIVDKCDFELELGKIQLPHFELPNGQTPDDYLKNLCQQGLKSRSFEKSPKEIQERLAYELKVIQQTGFASYFLIVQDFVNWAKSKKIVVGPGRGSAPGSLISYLINITDIDPLKYDLLFERFMSGERISMPDIDLDFADDRRDEVIEYVSEKYGQDHVAQIITFGTMAARAAIRDVGRAMDYPYNFCDQIAKMIPFGSSLEKAIYESQELHSTYESDENAKQLIDMAMKLEGVARHASTHACGVVITKDPLNLIVPCQHPTQGDETVVTQYEMHSIEDLGLLKMDFLGLKTLTVIQNTLNQIKESTGKEIDLAKLPLDDQKTLELFKQAKTTSVFQLESQGIKRYLKDLKPTKFEDIIAMVALYRPGPMEFIPEFIARKHGLKEIKYLHPKLKPILEDTYAVMVYQEQLMRIARDLGGFSLSEADVLRKAVGKKIKKLLDEQKGKLIQGMIDNEIEPRTAKRIWKTIEPFAQYGFNKSHSTCYALIGYQTAYLKAHYPTEFMAAAMTSDQKDIERIAFLVDECRNMQVKVLAPNVNQSNQDFSKAAEKTINFGLKAIKNVGHNVVQVIIEERKSRGQFKSIADFIERVSVTTEDQSPLNKKSLESLIKCGALDTLGERNQLLGSLDQLLGLSREAQKSKQNHQISLFDSHSEVATPSFRLPKVAPATKKERLSWEKELLGLYVSEHPLENYRKKLDRIAFSCQTLSKRQVGQRVKIGGIINKIKKINTRAGQPMLFVEIEDTTGRIEVLVFANTLEQTATAWQEEKIVLVSGRLSDRDANLKIICDNVKVLE
ncbi:MAG: DNA polymerase III subunit alpha [Parcubacteria group bacterium]|jgi:DNA polymerase-3 subunit alpha|nr:DNA polymerase III subunit alpha [Parcubacteria group bacterium]|tara:strand:+ start:15890 stop:19066 length:3177 start_codon:yes stop_codon:yes gene_type:complete